MPFLGAQGNPWSGRRLGQGGRASRRHAAKNLDLKRFPQPLPVYRQFRRRETHFDGSTYLGRLEVHDLLWTFEVGRLRRTLDATGEQKTSREESAQQLRNAPLRWSERQGHSTRSQNVTAEVLVLDNFCQLLLDVGSVNTDSLLLQVRTFEGYLVQNFFHDGVEASRPNVF